MKPASLPGWEMDKDSPSLCPCRKQHSLGRIHRSPPPHSIFTMALFN